MVESKTKKFSCRLSAEEQEIFQALAKEQKVSLSEFIRHAVINYAQMSIENKSLFGKNNDEEIIHTLLTDTREILSNSIKGSNDLLSSKLLKIEKMLDVFMYAYLFHTPEVDSNRKNEAKNSAIDRKNKILQLMKTTSEKKGV